MLLAAEQMEPMSPIAFELGPLSVHWYGIILGTAALIALLLSIREGKKHGIPSDTFLDLMLFAVPAGVLGGRLYYVIFSWEHYSKNPQDILAVWQGGLAIHGVIISGVLTLIIFVKKKKLSFWKMADILAPHVLLAQGIGRWGNFMNQEAHGGPVSREFLENLHIPDFIINQMYIYSPVATSTESAGWHYYHPTFLYESIWNIIGFLVLINLRKLNFLRGEIFMAYLIWYSTGRVFIEGMRTDPLMLTEHIRMAQALSVTLIVIALVIILVRRKKRVDRYIELDT